MSSPHTRAYLDHNATSPLLPAVRDAMVEALALGNPSSIHREGRAARAAVEDARQAVGRLAGVAAEDVIFTSGATEALNMALLPAAEVLLLGAAEHLAVREGHGYGSACGDLPVDGRGVVCLDGVRAALAAHAGRRVVVAVQSANNETGAIQPIAEIASLVHDAGGHLVCDAVQSAGKVELAAGTCGADVVILSAHKIGGPKGVGALCVRTRDAAPAALLRGGGQERGFRAGTENVAGIVGFGVAAARADTAAPLAVIRDDFEVALHDLAPDARVFGVAAPRLPNTTCFAVPRLEAQLVIMALDVAGVAASSGSACTSGRVRPSHVLAAMGVDPILTKCAVRLSLGPDSTHADMTRVIDTLDVLLHRTRRVRAAA